MADFASFTHSKRVPLPDRDSANDNPLILRSFPAWPRNYHRARCHLVSPRPTPPMENNHYRIGNFSILVTSRQKDIHEEIFSIYGFVSPLSIGVSAGRLNRPAKNRQKPKKENKMPHNKFRRKIRDAQRSHCGTIPVGRGTAVQNVLARKVF